jgi:hypothetical protein
MLNRAAAGVVSLLGVAACSSTLPAHSFDTVAIRDAAPRTEDPTGEVTLYVNEFLDEAWVPGLLASAQGVTERLGVQIGGELPGQGAVLVPDLEDILCSPLRGEGVLQDGVMGVAYLAWRLYVDGEEVHEIVVQAKGSVGGPWANERVMHRARGAALQAVFEESRRALVGSAEIRRALRSDP